MREKLLDLMKYEGLKPSQLAEMLEINPAGVSHILAGRNKPGFDLLQKILRRFPRINPDWLLLDSDRMYRIESQPKSESSASSASAHAKSDDAFGLFAAASQNTSKSSSVSSTTPRNSHVAESSSGFSGSPAGIEIPASSPNERGATVTRVVLFYDDQTCESYSPTKR